MRIVVTGGAGFIGSALTHHLVDNAGHDVVVLDAFTYAANPASLAGLSDRSNLRIVRHDIRELKTTIEILEDIRPEAIFHLAAESHVDRSITGAGPFIETNVFGTFALLEGARSVWAKLDRRSAEQFRFVHVSTDEVYGSLGPQGAFVEDSPYAPSSPYSATKASADHLALAWHRTYGLPVMVANCTNNYGPRQFPEKLIPLTILNAIEGRELPVYGDGLNVRDWLHVDDHVRALESVQQRGRIGERYAIGARSEQRNIDVVNAICDQLDLVVPGSVSRRSLVRFVDDRPGHDRRYAIDPTKTETELGWRAEVSFEEGLKRTIAWYLENKAWWATLRPAR